jgi:hypothetical protein
MAFSGDSDLLQEVQSLLGGMVSLGFGSSATEA